MAAVIAAFLVAVLFASDVAESKPNIIFIMADDLGYNDVSYHGHGEISTPNIDRLANNGVKLENYYVAPSCGPTRSQFLSGKYSSHLGLHDSNLPPCTRDALPLTENTIADVLKGEGYATHMIGKWHAGFQTAEFLPTNRGFDTFRGLLLASGDHFTHTTRHNGTRYLDFYDNDQPYSQANGTYSTTEFTNRAKELINSHNQSMPMFMYLSYQAPHSPIQFPSTFTPNSNILNEDRRSYSAMVSLLDEGVGQVVDTLNSTGMLANTVIIFSSDNGGSNGNGASNYPLRGQKGTYYQGGVKAVGFVHSPLLRTRRNGRSVNGLIHVTDWLPTMLSIARGTSTNLNIDGLNQWNTIEIGGNSPRTEVLLNIGEKTASVDVSEPFDESITAALIAGRWKILTGTHHSDVLYPNPQDDYAVWDIERSNRTSSTTTKLFNLRTDPTESNDLSAQRTTVVTNMLRRLRELQVTMIDPIDDQEDQVACDPAKHGGFWGPWLTS